MKEEYFEGVLQRTTPFTGDRQGKLSAAFTFSIWSALFKALKADGSGDAKLRPLHEAMRLRDKVVHTNPDYSSRNASMMNPRHRQAWFEYWRNGILLPFGTTKKHFKRANPLMCVFDGTFSTVQKVSKECRIVRWQKHQVVPPRYLVSADAAQNELPTMVKRGFTSLMPE
ncbi:hypothetical protein YB2330_001789 [Saitoella coloradoensis]